MDRTNYIQLPMSKTMFHKRYSFLIDLEMNKVIRITRSAIYHFIRMTDV